MFFLSSLQMYKVFFNDYLIQLETTSKNLRSGNISESVEIQGYDGFLSVLKGIENSKYVEEPILRCWITEEKLPELLAGFNQVPAAGGVARNSKGELLFIRRFGRWDLPKGRIEKGELAADAAVREVEEECGISGLSLVRELQPSYHIFRSPYFPKANNWVWKKTHWFEMHYAGTETLVPQKEEDITEVRWFAPNELSEVLDSTYENLKELITSYLP